MRLKIFTALAALFCLSACKPFVTFSSYRISTYRYLEHAEELSRKGQDDEAIELYKKHIQYRLALSDRPEWENPHFYEIIIGDLELRQGRLDAALAAYETAEREGVDHALVSDRFRHVARWYETQGKLNEAMDVLQRYRDRDELLFDLILDRIARRLVAEEERAGHTGEHSPTPTIAVTAVPISKPDQENSAIEDQGTDIP